MRISAKYKYKTYPIASPEAVIKGDKYRFTILTSRLIRAEYNENGEFEDRATQTVINRTFPAVPFTVDDGDVLTIRTEHIELTYYKRPFNENSLFIEYIGANSCVNAGDDGSKKWGFALTNKSNYKGTARTLDKVNGACELENGLMSRGNVTVLDDSDTLIIAEDGWVDVRDEKYIDTYLFCYGDAKKGFDCKGCLKDFYKLTGKTPLLPRYVLGNWWSRYYAYTQEEYTDLINRFKKEDIPFSVAVIDMDWHLTEIDFKYGNGWTGYTWNDKLFPDHKEFLNFLHDEGMKVTLNLHPHGGCAAHEAAYPDMAKAMGINPDTEEAVGFDIANPKFLENYFEHMHHPLEAEGVDFWWIDWQQGNNTNVAGLDPLWMLNHYHYIDNDRDEKRPLVFSRYSGPGSHRYPIGFSGDTVITWESLDFQPYFTATASNIGYGWWSHDIGGHMMGCKNGELTARWVQLGVFSPINRLHSAIDKAPWKFGLEAELSMKKFLKLRHELIPYLYSMNYRASEYGEPIVMPLYYNWTGQRALTNPNEYTFGTEMLVKPITRPCDSDTKLGSTEVWFPEGEWYDFFSNRRYKGKKALTVYRALDEMPVFVKAGGIVPLAELRHINDTENPVDLRIKVYVGADNSFELYEDDGETKDYLDGKSAVTKIEVKWGSGMEFIINPPQGDLEIIPQKRNYRIEFIGIKKPEAYIVTVGEKTVECNAVFDNNVFYISVPMSIEEIKIKIAAVEKKENNIIEDCINYIEMAEIENDIKQHMCASIKENPKSARAAADLIEWVSGDVYKSIMEILTAEL